MLKEKLIEALKAYKLNVLITEEVVGPRTRTFVLELGGVTTVRQIRSRLEDLAVRLHAASVTMRLEEGQLTLEVSRTDAEYPKLFDLVRKSAVNKPGQLVLGLSNTGRVVQVELRSLPHLLVAGTTGSGKSVALHSILTGLIATHSPRDLRVILVDPKQLELRRYAGLPHISHEIVTTAQAAARVLLQLVQLMERRYSELSAAGLTDAHDAPDRFPIIVVCIDEYADLLEEDDCGIEEYLIRLAAKSRAAGIHLVVATQRPSVDVVTGLLKANIPARLALRTASSVDSRVILDAPGADKLLGRGDGIFSAGGSTTRLQVPFTTDADALALHRHYSARN